MTQHLICDMTLYCLQDYTGFCFKRTVLLTTSIPNTKSGCFERATGGFGVFDANCFFFYILTLVEQRCTCTKTRSNDLGSQNGQLFESTERACLQFGIVCFILRGLE